MNVILEARPSRHGDRLAAWQDDPESASALLGGNGVRAELVEH